MRSTRLELWRRKLIRPLLWPEHYRRSSKRAWLFMYSELRRRQLPPVTSTSGLPIHMRDGQGRNATPDLEDRSAPVAGMAGSALPSPLPSFKRRRRIAVIDLVTDSDDSDSRDSIDGGDQTDGSSIVEIVQSPVRRRRRCQSPISIRSTPSPPPISLHPCRHPVMPPRCHSPRPQSCMVPFHRRSDQDEVSESTDSESDLDSEPARPSYTEAELGQFITLTSNAQLEGMFFDTTIRPHHHWRVPPV